MKYYIIAGEASGDLHGSRLIAALKEKDPQAEIRCWGGDLMQAEGGVLVKHYKGLAFMGFWEVIKNLGTIFSNLSFCKKDITQFQPDVMVYVDYPGFNMRIAKWAKQMGFKNHYYISPQIWAWKENRIKKIKRDLDVLYTILPFEKTYFQEKHQYKTLFVGHPLVEIISEKQKEPLNHVIKANQPIIALLPGSRKQEIEKMMPLFLAVVPHFPDFDFVIAGAPGIPKEWYHQFTKDPRVKLLHNQTYDLLKQSFAAIVTSGTATLETALFGVPQMVCYRSSNISYWIAKRVVNLPFISLVNLIMDKEVVRELIQNECTVSHICEEIKEITSPSKRANVLENYSKIKTQLGKKKASEEVAKHIIATL